MEKVKVIIVDDHEIFRKGLIMHLKRIEFVDLIDDVSSGNELLSIMKNIELDLVLLDINMPEMDGIETAKKAIELNRKLKIIALTTHNDKKFFENMHEAGAEGYLLKNTNLAELKTAIAQVIAGGNYYSHEILMLLTQDLLATSTKKDLIIELPKITNREQEVLEGICKGYSNEKIGEQLNISVRTVEGHKYKLLEKTNTENTVNLVIFAFKNKLVAM